MSLDVLDYTFCYYYRVARIIGYRPLSEYLSKQIFNKYTTTKEREVIYMICNANYIFICVLYIPIKCFSRYINKK